MRAINLNIWLLVWVLVVVLAVPAAADTHYVNPGESIQAAIDDANDGDEIEVAAGTYNEAIDFVGKAIRLYSTAGPNNTTIDGTGNFHVVQCVNGEDANTILKGFMITGGDANGPWPDNCGGGMYNNSSSPTVTNCLFTENSASADGGGMYNYPNSSPTVTNCIFRANTANYGGGMYSRQNSNPTVSNCTFSGNSSEVGGGMENYNSSPTVINCTFSGNTAQYGGGMDNYNSNPTVTNCILWGNTAPTGPQIYGGSPTVTYSDVQAGWAGTGNINADPLFVDAANGDLRLMDCSICADAGNSDAVPPDIVDLDGDGDINEPIPFDLGRNPRLVDDATIPDTGSGTPPIVDIGAYERQSDSLSCMQPVYVYNWTQEVAYAEIQSAIDEANDGDQIEVAPGTYYEAINFNGKAVRLYSIAGPNVTTIDGTGAYHVVQCVSGEDANTILEGFTITGGNASGTGHDAYGGGMYNWESSPTVTDCLFAENTANVHGGGMYNYPNSSPTVTNCIFTDNVAGYGGGMCNYYNSNPTVTNCTFNGNWAIEGGGMYNDISSPTVTNCIFSGNSTHYSGGAMCNDMSEPTVTNCTFSGNSSNYDGGGMYNYPNSSPTVTNCILWGNTAPTGPEVYGSATVTYSNVEGGYTGTGNIDADPLFVDAAGGDLRPRGDSPCIDAGNNSNVPSSVITDLAGGARFIDNHLVADTGAGTPPIVDMGAYEYRPKTVDDDGPADFNSIQSAIDAASNCDEIEVAPGTYNEAIDFKGKAIRLYSSDGPAVTTIDANGLNSSVAICNSGEDSNTILEGFTITGGNALNGGGMYIYGSRPTVSNCIFTDNVAGYGGGIFNEAHSPMVTNCIFLNNAASIWGGGMFNKLSNPTVSNCNFLSNTAGWDGGGIFNEAAGPTVTDCNFTNNVAGYSGGGMYSKIDSNSIVSNCIFSNNKANGNTGNQGGGGMYNLDNSSPTVTDCSFAGNSAAYTGGGVCNSTSSNPTMTNCIFTGNSSDYGGGGVCNSTYSNPTMTNCTFSGNSTNEYGGGMYIDYGSDITLTNCTFAANSAINDGNALACDSYNQSYPSNLQVANCILWDGVDQIWNNDNSIITITYSDVQGGWSGTGNIDADPRFADPNNPDPNLHNLRLKPDSPCIDAGNTTVVPWGIWADLDGNARVLDNPASPDTGVSVLGLTVDMGAYEFQRCQIPGDNNCDGVVDFKDLAILCNNWLAGTEPEL